MGLVHCIYSSAATKKGFTAAELATLLEECRTKNAQADITGMLLYRDGTFFQVIEGERSVIESLLNKLEKDQRHHRVTKIILEPIEARAFAEWTMGYSTIAANKLAEIPGLNDFFTRGMSFLELGEGRAKTLLSAFKDGQWRRSLT
jgi:hypothetical protein